MVLRLQSKILLNIQYGGTGLSNLLLLSGVDENVDYQQIFQQNPYHVALIAFAGPGIANGGMFCFHTGCCRRSKFTNRPYFYYFILWFNLMNIANLFNYIPFQTFTPVNWDTDMSNLERGLNISPWVVYVVGGYLVLFVIWQFFSKTIVESYVPLGLGTAWIRSFLLIFALSSFCLDISARQDCTDMAKYRRSYPVTSRWLCPVIIAFCWPERQWVREKIAAITPGGSPQSSRLGDETRVDP